MRLFYGHIVIRREAGSPRYDWLVTDDRGHVRFRGPASYATRGSAKRGMQGVANDACIDIECQHETLGVTKPKPRSW